MEGSIVLPLAEAEGEDAEESLLEDLHAHFGGAEDAVGEDDGDLEDFEAQAGGGVLHFDLEGIADELDLVELHFLEDLAAVADEAGGGVEDAHASDEVDILGGVVGHHETAHGPVDDADFAVDIARADDDIALAGGAGLVEPREVVGIVGEVGVHLDHIVVAMLEAPLEAGEVGGAEAEFAFALLDEEAVGEFLHETLDDVGSAVGGVVLDDEHVELLREGEDLANDFLDVLLLIIGGSDD